MHKEIYLKDYKPSAFQINEVFLEFSLDSKKTQVITQLNIIRKNHSETDLILVGEKLKLISLKMNESPVDFLLEEGGLRIPHVPDHFILEIITEINPQANTELTGLYLSNGVFCTQCEAEYFRKITYYLDRPDILAFFTVKIIANKKDYPVLLSNGNLMESGDLENNRHYALWKDPFKKPSYLFALVAGDLEKISDEFITQSGRKVTLNIYSEKANIDRCFFAMRCLKNAMRWDEVTYHREYDLDIFNIVAINDFVFGAMENKSLNIFNAKYILANAETATDQDYADIDTVIAHEYFHNWSGNRVTCRDWFQLSLKEGFTIFREQSYDEDHHSSVVHRIRKVQDLRNGQFAEDAGPMAHAIRPESYIAIDNFYTRTVYNKGGEVVRMFKTILGEALYYQATDRYFEKFDGQAVTTDDFVDMMQAVSPYNLAQFRLWYSQSGTPFVQASSDYDLEKKTWTITFEQHIPSTPYQNNENKQPMMIPIAMALLSYKNQEVIHEQVLLLEKEKQSFVFHEIEAEVIPSLNRHFSSPIKLYYPYSEQALLFLFQHDTDGFNRWEAGQQLACDIILKDKPSEHYLIAMGEILQEPFDDYSMQAELLSLPSEKYLHENVELIDVKTISMKKEALFLAIAKKHENLWLELYHKLNHHDYDYTPKLMGYRRLRSLCLQYLLVLGKQNYIDLAYTQFKTAGNMTESLSALSALSHTDTLERVQALAYFQDHWQNEPLVMNKWFAVQAQSRLPSTLSNVKTLMQQPFFHIKNPNSVYALIGSFCSQNMLNFHDLSGAGYDFCADCVILLDAFNPMVAARIVEPLLAWKRFSPEYASLMKKALEKIMGSAHISKNIHESVSKALA